ncbi:MAG: sigma-70 family RNA polymerase sigma factor [Oscillospiraceae bacterium]|nr:sigma-70 family RNA polymerase sigma factor [Oscillospiraceae bacterium]
MPHGLVVSDNEEKKHFIDDELTKLVVDAIDGGKAELSLLCKQIINPVLYRIMRTVDNRSDAEDIAQEVMLLICRNIKKVRDPNYFRLWLNKIAAHEIHRYFKKNHDYNRKIESIDDCRELANESEASMPMERVINKEAFEIISKMVKNLPRQQQMVVKLKYYEGLTVTEIAKETGLAKTSISTHLARAHVNIKSELEKIASTEIFLFSCNGRIDMTKAMSQLENEGNRETYTIYFTHQDENSIIRELHRDISKN